MIYEVQTIIFFLQLILFDISLKIGTTDVIHNKHLLKYNKAII